MARGAAWNWMVLWTIAVALGTRALLGFSAFPIAEDFSYAPLAEIWADPGLYPRDDLLHRTANHAWAYNALYWLAKSTIGVAAGFWVAVVALSVASVTALHAIMVRVGAAGLALPLAIALGVMVLVPGVGRGLFGGFVGSFFHHQWIALALVMWAFVAALGGRSALAGLALGAAAYAQPMLALHGGLAVAVACATQGRPGLRVLGIAGGTAVTVALPYEIFAILPALGEAGAAASADRPIEDSYLFLSPYRNQIARSDLLLGWGYLGLGLISAMLLRRERPGHGNLAPGTMALALICGLGALHGVTTLVYFAADNRYAPLDVLDPTRSSPLFFALSAALFAAAMERRIEAGLKGAGWESPVILVVAGAAGLTILALNTTPPGWFFALSGALLVSAPDRIVPKAALSVMLVMLFGLTAYKVNLRPADSRDRAELFDWATRETSADALFIVPPGMHGFRLLAQRSVYAEYKLASPADPDLALTARARLEKIARPGPKAIAARGREAVQLWDRAYTRAATCAWMVRVMRETGAEYFVRPIADRSGEAGLQPDCRGYPKIAFTNATLTVYSVIQDRVGALE